METRIVVPALGESVVEATVARWLKKEGDAVDAGEVVVELETDKVNLEVGAEKSGVLVRIERQSGEDVKVGDVLGVLGDTAGAPVEKKKMEAKQQAPVVERKKEEAVPSASGKIKATPSARRLAQEQSIELQQVARAAGGKQVTRQDVEEFAKKAPAVAPSETPPVAVPSWERAEERVRMSRRRRTIAQRLVEAQHTAAMLTTYNEVDMTAILELRKRRKESFQKRHGVSLGIVSFFVKATIGALKEFPALNAEIQGEEIVFKHYYDIGIAIGAPEGLVVPVLRDADRMSFPQMEKGIRDFIQKSEEGKLSLEDLRGGTFTITNGGVFGSLLSTPILNPPQVGILGLHKIEDRPIAVNGQIAVRPMMYVALSYDHRIVDGRESVQFLARIKELIEDPGVLLLQS
jgi:2-oxoglutarate dehydrogenase E2 component (dihydrolipoamide succinyltransferase)